MGENTKIIVFFDLLDTENQITILSNRHGIKLAIMREASNGLTEFNEKKYETLTLAETRDDSIVDKLYSKIEDKEYQNTIDQLNEHRKTLETDIAVMQETRDTIIREVKLMTIKKTNKQYIEEKL